MAVSTESVQAVVILNGSAGSGCNAEFANDLANKFQAQGLRVNVTLAASGEELIETARRAVREGVKIVIAGGGDGTLNAVASALVGTDTAFGVLPMGTLNHFAKDLHIPLELDSAIGTIIQGHSQQVDTGEINGRLFLNNSSLGLYPDTVRERERQQKRLGRGKWLAFFWAAVTALRRYPFLDVSISLDSGHLQRRTPFIFIGNNAYLMEGFNIGERERLDAAQLSLYVVQRTGRLGLLALAMRALFGRLRQAKDFDVLTAKAMQIKTRHKHLRVSTDGEVSVMQSPLDYRIRAASLKVIVPRGDSATA
ncbi:MAG: diacylglycerol kinase family protein [Polaromonas sp.]